MKYNEKKILKDYWTKKAEKLQNEKNIGLIKFISIFFIVIFIIFVFISLIDF